MVKGVGRRVVVVKSPDPKLFEQAIFLLREDTAPDGAPEEQVLKQAQQVANSYLLRSSPQGRRRRVLVPLLFTLLGGVVASAGWLFLPKFFSLPF